MRNSWKSCIAGGLMPLWKQVSAFLQSCMCTHLMPRSPSPVYSTQRNASCVHTNTCMWMIILALFIIVKKKLETTPVSFIRIILKDKLVHPHSGIPLSSEEEPVIETGNLEEPQKQYSEWKKLALKGYILSGSIYTIFSKRHKTMGMETRLVAWEAGVGDGMTTRDKCEECFGVAELCVCWLWLWGQNPHKC